MRQENICQFYIIMGDKDFRPLNNKDVYINATGVLDNNLIRAAIWREFDKIKELNKKNRLNIMIDNEIIFLIPPSIEYEERCQEIINALDIRGRIEYITKKEEKRKEDNVKKVETELKNNNNITASGSENIEVQKDTGVERVTINDNKAYVNSGMLSIDEQKFSLLQEWKKDPYMSSKLVGLSQEEIDKMLMESVTMNLTTHRMESSREQNANDKASEVAKDKAAKEDGLYNSNLRIVRNNVGSFNKYSTVEEKEGKTQVVNPNVSNSTINSGGISNEFGGRTEENITEEVIQIRENLGEYYLDEEYNIYDSDGNVLGKVGQNGVWVDYNTNTLVVNGRLVGYIGDYKNMKRSEAKDKKNVRVKKKEENKSAAFVSLSVIMFVLSSVLLIGSMILLFVL